MRGAAQAERPPVLFRATSADRKLSPVDFVENGTDRLRPVPRAPFCSSSYSSIEATCPDLCPWKTDGCFVREGFTGAMSAELDRAALASTGDVVTFLLAQLLDKSFGGKRGTWPSDGGRDGRSPRDHRINNGGDVSSERGARWVAAAARRCQNRGAGGFWGYTHRWREIPLDAFGVINVLASVESVADAFLAMARGYAPAITLPHFPSERAFTLRGPRAVGPRIEVAAELKVIPCPAETSRGTTCVECRLCIDRPLRAMNVAIGFKAHGKAAARMRARLPVIDSAPSASAPGVPPRLRDRVALGAEATSQGAS